MQALLAFAVSWPKLDKVKVLLIGLRDFLCVWLCFVVLDSTRCLSLLFLIVPLLVTHFFLFTPCLFLFAEGRNELLVRSMTHSIQIRLIYALLNSRFLFTGATHLSSSLSKAHRGLVKLSLSHCGLTGKGVAQIGHALVLNKCMASSLQHLDLSSNVAKDDINVRIKVMNPYCELV
jgi:hypothetical protein